MKLSNEIKDVLSNFQTINSNIALGEDNGVIRTMSTSKTLMAKANKSLILHIHLAYMT